jgi:DNA-binding GntR family transcriptional regulator
MEDRLLQQNPGSGATVATTPDSMAQVIYVVLGLLLLALLSLFLVIFITCVF